MLPSRLFMDYLIPASASFLQAWGQEHRPEAGRDKRRLAAWKPAPLIDSLGLLTDPQDGLIEVLTINGTEKQHPSSARNLKETGKGV